MESNFLSCLQQVAAENDRGASSGSLPVPDCWAGLSRDVIERFIEVTAVTRKVSVAERGGYRADLYALEAWMQRLAGHTVMTASTAELWAYFRKAIALGLEPRLLDRLFRSIQHFYAYARHGGFREDDPALAMPQWVHKYSMPAGAAPAPAAVHANA